MGVRTLDTLVQSSEERVDMETKLKKKKKKKKTVSMESGGRMYQKRKL